MNMMENKNPKLNKLDYKESILGLYNPTFWKEARVKHFRYRYFTVSQLMHFDVHLGGNERDIIETSYWFLYGRRKGFVFIDLHPTILMLRRLILVISSVIKNFGKFMFVDSDRQYCWGTQRLAMQVGEAYCIFSWVGGLLTNFKKIWAFYNVALRHKEWGLLRRPKARLKFILQGLDALSGPPSLIFINRLAYGHNAAAESHAVCIPSIGLVDLNTYSNEATYLIPSNDDSKRTVSYFNQLITRAVMKSKLHRALSFIRRKNVREQRGNIILQTRIMDMRKMLNVYRKLETRHTVHFKMPLRDWAALRKARTVFLGFPVPYLTTKSAISFIFKRLKKEYFIDKWRLNSLRKLKQKASFIYKRYYAQFFNVKPKLEIFHKTDDKDELKKEFLSVTFKEHHKRFPSKVLTILQKIRWLYDIKNKYQHLSAWLQWRVYNQWKTLSNLDENIDKLLYQDQHDRLQRLVKFFSFIKKESRKLNKLYGYFVKNYYKPLQALISDIDIKLDKNDAKSNINSIDLGEAFNNWYFGKNNFKMNIQQDSHFLWQRALIKYDIAKRRSERSRNTFDFRKKSNLISSKDNAMTLKTDNGVKMFNRTKFNKKSNQTFYKNRTRNSLRYRNPYSWKFRRLWKPRRISHFYKFNPYYLALLRNRPWFPMRDVVKYEVMLPRNSNQQILKHKVMYKLIKNDLDFFLRDSSFTTHKDLTFFDQQLKLNTRSLKSPVKLLLSSTVDYFKPVSFFDIIPRNLRWYYHYWNFKWDPKAYLSYMKSFYQISIDNNKEISMQDSKFFMYNFFHTSKEAFKSQEISQKETEKQENNPMSFFGALEGALRKDKISSFYNDFVFNNPQLSKARNTSLFRYKQPTINHSMVVVDFYSQMFGNKTKKRTSTMTLKAKSRLKMLKTFSNKVEWASDYYELLGYNRHITSSYLSSLSAENNMFLSKSDAVTTKWNLITHLQRYQMTPSFLRFFVLGHLRSSSENAVVKSPHLRRLKRKIDLRNKKQKSYNLTTQKSKQPSLNVQYNLRSKTPVKGHFNSFKKSGKFISRNKTKSPNFFFKRQQRFESLKKLFPFYFWLRWYKGTDLISLFYKNIVYSYLNVFKKLLLRFKNSKNLSRKVNALKQLFTLFQSILNILVYKTGNASSIHVLSQLRDQLKLNPLKRKSENVILYLKTLLENITKISEKKKPSRHSKFVSLSYLWRFFYKNTAKAYLMPARVLATKNVALIDLYHRKSVFFNRHGFAFLKDDVFQKVGQYYSKDNRFLYNNSNYDYLAGIPGRTAKRIFMRRRSKFNYNKYLKFYWLKLSKRFRGRVLLEALFNDFKFGKVKTPRHYRMIREVVYRLHHINKQRHSIFVEMFQNNPYVDRPHLKAHVDKYSGSHLFFLKNYGPKRFLRKRKFDTLDAFYFIRWFLRHKQGVPMSLRRKFMFLFRMWNNKSMFLSS